MIDDIHELSTYFQYLKSTKDENIWVFGAIRGEKYMDNARYLYEYIHHKTSIRAVWISRNNNIVSRLIHSGCEAFHYDTEEALSICSQASIAVITHRGNRKKADLPFHAMNARTKIVQLWHGIPLKKIAYDDTFFSHKVNEKSFVYRVKILLKNSLFPYLKFVNEPSLIIALSDETCTLFSRAFRRESEYIKITGYPRNDELIEKNITPEYKKSIIYMPTFRGTEMSNFDCFRPYDFDVNIMDNFLQKLNYQLDIKLHPFNRPTHNLIEAIRCSKNIELIEVDDIYDTLSMYDILITDYSSVYFDYLLLNKPIIFAPFDKEAYLQNDRAFYFEYDEVTPGPKALNWDEVMDSIEAFEKDKDWYESERQMIKNRFHTYQDAQSCKRVYNAIKVCLDG